MKTDLLKLAERGRVASSTASHVKVTAPVKRGTVRRWEDRYCADCGHRLIRENDNFCVCPPERCGLLWYENEDGTGWQRSALPRPAT